MIKKLGETFCVVVAAAFALSGCAHYRFGNAGRVLPGGYDRVAVPVFVNKTKEVGIESFFTEALRTQFERSRLAKVASVNDAQMILEGTVVSVMYTPTIQVTSTSQQIFTPNPVDPNPASPTFGLPTTPDKVLDTQRNPLPSTAVLNKQYNVDVTVHIDARKTSDHSVIWASDFKSQRTYNAPLLATPTLRSGQPGTNSQAPLYNESSRQDTIARLAVDMMAEAHDRLTENF